VLRERGGYRKKLFLSGGVVGGREDIYSLKSFSYNEEGPHYSRKEGEIFFLP